MYQPEPLLGTSLDYFMIESGLLTEKVIRHFTSMPGVHLTEAQFLSMALWLRMCKHGKLHLPLCLHRQGPNIEIPIPDRFNKLSWILDFVKEGTLVSSTIRKHPLWGEGERWQLVTPKGETLHAEHHPVEVRVYKECTHAMIEGVA